MLGRSGAEGGAALGAGSGGVAGGDDADGRGRACRLSFIDDGGDALDDGEAEDGVAVDGGADAGGGVGLTSVRTFVPAWAGAAGCAGGAVVSSSRARRGDRIAKRATAAATTKSEIVMTPAQGCDDRTGVGGGTSRALGASDGSAAVVHEGADDRPVPVGRIGSFPVLVRFAIPLETANPLRDGGIVAT